MIVDQDGVGCRNEPARHLFPAASMILAGAAIVLLAVGGVMAWQHYAAPSEAVSRVTMEETEREVVGVAGEMREVKFEISNGADERIRIVGLADC